MLYTCNALLCCFDIVGLNNVFVCGSAIVILLLPAGPKKGDNT